jgi:F0F1-type ATP synthase epsilon subunit
MKCIIKDESKKEVFDDALSVNLPAAYGQTQFLSGHAESFANLKEGIIKINLNNDVQTRAVKNGLCYAKDDLVKVFLIA